MNNKVLCHTCRGRKQIFDSQGGAWSCPRCNGQGYVEPQKPTVLKRVCSEHNVEMNWEGLGSGYWSCPVEH